MELRWQIGGKESGKMKRIVQITESLQQQTRFYFPKKQEICKDKVKHRFSDRRYGLDQPNKQYRQISVDYQVGTLRYNLGSER
jgi:hypothetical protein